MKEWKRRKKLRGITTAIKTQETTFDGEKLQERGRIRPYNQPSAFMARSETGSSAPVTASRHCEMPSPWYGGGTRHGLYGKCQALPSRPCGCALHRSARGNGKELREFGEVATEVGGEMVGGPGL